MARASSKRLLTDYEPKRRNPITLGDDSFLDSHLKPIKIDSKNSILELSDDELKVRGTIDASTVNVSTLNVEKIEIEDLDLEASGDITLDADGGNFYFYDDSLASLDDSGTSHNLVKFSSPTNLGARNHIVTIIDMKNALGSGTGSGPSISFKKWQSKAGLFSGASEEEDTGDIAFLCENNWKDDAADRDSKLVIRNVLNGELQDSLTIESDNTTTLYGDVKMPATSKLYLDAGTDTYIHESGADIMKLVVGDVALLVLTEAGGGASDKVAIPALTPLYFDGGTDTHIAESAADVLDITVGTLKMMTLDEGNTKVEVLGADLEIDAAKAFYLDGGGDTKIFEHSADYVRYTVGDDIMMSMDENGDDGNQVYFNDASVGFQQLEPTYDSGNTVVDFRHSNKQNLTFGAGNITHLQLYFPNMSGNFQLLIKQDGTGSRTITGAYKVYEFDESVATVGNVVFAGGSAPTLTTDANHVDILSFYWDADNEIAYGVATLDFQF